MKEIQMVFKRWPPPILSLRVDKSTLILAFNKKIKKVHILISDVIQVILLLK